MANNKKQRPTPNTHYDKLRENLSSGFSEGFPQENYPPPDNRPNINRGRITSRKDDKVGDVSIGIQDHDEAIAYYFDNVIKPSVMFP